MITKSYAVFWFRRDLRIEDNAGLFYALSQYEKVIPLFIFDTEILTQLDDFEDKRVSVIYHFLKKLHSDLRESGSSLVVKYGKPVTVMAELLSEFEITAVYTNRDYEPAALTRDEKVAQMLKNKNVQLLSFKDQVIFEADDVLKPDCTPYTVFTPYSKRWKSNLEPKHYLQFQTNNLRHHLHQFNYSFPELSVTGFKEQLVALQPLKINPFIIKHYDETRNYPYIENGTSGLSVHLRFGTVSIRELVRVAIQFNESWLNELIWREFFKQITMHYPHVVNQSFRTAYDEIPWRNNVEEFEHWCNGTTGYPIVDAGMRQLKQTGLMHNRVRMITASFLTKHLLIDWRWGEAWFAKHLLDYDQSANNGNWQWAAGSGCDAVPYFRVFNPDEQTKKFDAKLTYITRWVPEIHSNSYYEPIVAHQTARQRAIETYKKALKKEI